MPSWSRTPLVGSMAAHFSVLPAIKSPAKPIHVTSPEQPRVPPATSAAAPSPLPQASNADAARHIRFIKDEHMQVLSRLHKEIATVKAENKDLKFRLVVRHSNMPERRASQAPHEETQRLQRQLLQLRETNAQLRRELEEERAHHLSETQRRSVCDHTHYDEAIAGLVAERDAALADVSRLRGTVEALEMCLMQERRTRGGQHSGGDGSGQGLLSLHASITSSSRHFRASPQGSSGLSTGGCPVLRRASRRQLRRPRWRCHR